MTEIWVQAGSQNFGRAEEPGGCGGGALKLRKWGRNPQALFDTVRRDGGFHREIGVATDGSAIAPTVVLIQPSPKKKQGPP